VGLATVRWTAENDAVVRQEGFAETRGALCNDNCESFSISCRGMEPHSRTFTRQDCTGDKEEGRVAVVAMVTVVVRVLALGGK
jgi:hypothetical protein